VKRERERENERGESDRAGDKNNFFYTFFKVPRQCPLALLVEVLLRQGENVKF
jgi:hypothetical protein